MAAKRVGMSLDNRALDHGETVNKDHCGEGPEPNVQSIATVLNQRIQADAQ